MTNFEERDKQNFFSENDRAQQVVFRERGMCEGSWRGIVAKLAKDQDKAVFSSLFQLTVHFQDIQGSITIIMYAFLKQQIDSKQPTQGHLCRNQRLSTKDLNADRNLDRIRPLLQQDYERVMTNHAHWRYYDQQGRRDADKLYFHGEVCMQAPYYFQAPTTDTATHRQYRFTKTTFMVPTYGNCAVCFGAGPMGDDCVFGDGTIPCPVGPHRGYYRAISITTP